MRMVHHISLLVEVLFFLHLCWERVYANWVMTIYKVFLVDGFLSKTFKVTESEQTPLGTCFKLKLEQVRMILPHVSTIIQTFINKQVPDIHTICSVRSIKSQAPSLFQNIMPESLSNILKPRFCNIIGQAIRYLPIHCLNYLGLLRG